VIALRVLLAALALSAVPVGAWAALAPRSFHADFPGGAATGSTGWGPTASTS